MGPPRDAHQDQRRVHRDRGEGVDRQPALTFVRFERDDDDAGGEAPEAGSQRLGELHAGLPHVSLPPRPTPHRLGLSHASRNALTRSLKGSRSVAFSKAPAIRTGSPKKKYS